MLLKYLFRDFYICSMLKFPLKPIVFIICSFICFGLFVYSTLTDDDKQQKEFETYYKIYSLASPKQLSFAGEPVPLSDADIQERYDRELLTNVYWQSQTVLMLKRGNKFFPLIEKILAEQGIPDDFKYLALAESGLQNVVSPAGASGYWQMLDATAKIYGLEINADVDERYHLIKSTEAACRYFKEAYGIFNSWALVAASYNMGIDGVRKQLQQQGVNSYYDLWLNTETARYVFRILAIKEIASRPKVFGFNIAEQHQYKLPSTVVIKINANVPDLVKFSLELNCNYKTLKQLNPWLRSKQLAVGSKPYYVELPKDKLLSSSFKNSVVNDTLVYN
jgi:membrane-bound lytic murein transglycosylase D